MTPQELKSSILQLAIQGRLVEQRPEEGTAEDLYIQIQQEKQALIKAGKIKKEKPLPEITEDEMPFDIPDSWKWVRVGSILHTLVDGTHRTPRYTLEGIPFVSVRNMSSGKLDLTDTRFISVKEHQELCQRCKPEFGDLLLSKVGTTGIPAKVDINDEFSLFVSVALLKFNGNLIDIDFFIHAIYSPDFQRQCKKHTRGVGNKNWVIKDIANTVFPLPPLAEQKRIVAKIEELLPLVDRYEQAWQRLEILNSRFPVDMQKSVLQLAIQGRLVPQRPEEGTGEDLFRQIQAEKQALIQSGKIKKEKPLPEITEDELPFDIPDSWKWVRLGDLFQHNTGKALNSSDKNGTRYEYITTSNVYWNEFKLDNLKKMLFSDVELEKCTVRKGDLLVLEGGDVGRAAIWNYDFEMRIQNHIHRMRPYGNVAIEYFYYIFLLYKSAGNINGKGIGIKGLSSNVLHNLPIPLPPLAEQKRIVARLEELLPLCERLR